MRVAIFIILVPILICLSSILQAQVKSPPAFGPVPSSNQLRWQQMEYYGFIHLSVNTYTDMAWGKGDEDPAIFNPVSLDCRQWARIAKQAGMKGIILTAKHHSGFCLWPSAYTDYSVKNSPWKNGKGDIVREMSEACKEYGLKLGLYLSPWDRNRADYGKPEYITYFRNQLRELLSNYGEVFEIWFDGANGGSGYYGGANETRTIDRTTYYEWSNTYKLVRSLQPKIVIWNDGGDRADLRWVGTEAGYVGETNWSLLDSTGDVPEQMLRYGVENGNSWVPGEVNTSIRPEWFYHAKEDTKVKTLPQLMDIYYNSIGRNGTLLLNFPIMPNGLIHPKDEKAVLEFREAVKKSFAINLLKGASAVGSTTWKKDLKYSASKTIDQSPDTYWAADEGQHTASITLNLSKPVSFNRFVAQEYISLGQRVKSFTVETLVNGKWTNIARETTIGYKRILRFKTVRTNKIRFTITDAKANPLISNIEIFNAPLILEPPIIRRDRSGDIHIEPADAESQLFYTLDGSTPTRSSLRYLAPVKTGEGKLLVKTIAYDPITGKTSTVSSEQFDVSRKNWKIIGETDDQSYQVIDGNPTTQWYQSNKKTLPVDLVIDLGKTETIAGFKYLPDQNWWASGIISRYAFYVSMEGEDWTLVEEGEFANIKNNPLLQTRSFPSRRARFIKLRALENTQSDNRVGYAEIDIITE
jgi:alpha-L-fucosidase